MAAFSLSQFPPEHAGVSSASILRFLDQAETRQLAMHSFILVRHGAILSQGYWAPFDKDTLQRTYSVSKSFTSLAVGLACEDGYFKLDDPIMKYFEDKVARQPHPYTLKMTIRDVLKMTTVHTKTATQIVPHPDWMKAFFNVTPSHAPGTVFNYDTSGSVALAALVERVTGMDLLDYLQKRLLSKIGFSENAEWGKIGPYTHGGSSLRCTTEDLAKVGLLCLQRGRWFGFQLLPKDYMMQATSKQVSTNFAQPGHGSFGYGYQFWMTDHDGFCMYGMGGQLVICLPKEDLVFVTTADTQANPGGIDHLFNAFWDTIYRELKDDAIPVNEADAAELAERLQNLEVRSVKGAFDSPIQRDIGGKRFLLDENPSRVRSVTVGFGGGYGTLQYETAEGSNELRFGFGKNIRQMFPDPALECLASGAWVDAETLFLRVYITDENLGSLEMMLHFGNDGSLTLHSRTFGDSMLGGGWDACVTGFVYE